VTNISGWQIKPGHLYNSLSLRVFVNLNRWVFTIKVFKTLKSLADWSIKLITRYPGLMALFGFVSGVASFFWVVREQEYFAQMISLLMLVSWVWLTLENLLLQGANRWFGIKLPEPLLKFATQMVHQESLFFVIPFFVITTTWNTPQALFTSFLIVAAVISVIDPVYHRWLARRRWLYFAYHGFTLFAVLLVALPVLMHIQTAKAYVWSLVIAIVLSFLNVVRVLPYRYWQRALAAIALIGSTTLLGVLIRQWVPPATLWLTQIAIASQIDSQRRAPTVMLNVVGKDQLADGLYAYTSIHAPRGLNEHIYHLWYVNGHLIDKIALDIVGGRDAGYRAWSHKLNFPPNPLGDWRIEVATEAHQLIGVLRFPVVYNSAPNGEDKVLAEQSAEPYTTPESVIRKPLIKFMVNEVRELLAAMGAEWQPSPDSADAVIEMGPEALPVEIAPRDETVLDQPEHAMEDGQEVMQ
jgi:hypothetical protein